MEISHELAIGIDIGGTNTKWGLVNHRGDIIRKGDLKTEGYPTFEAYIDALYNTLTPVMEEVEDGKTVKGIGIGAPNGNYYKGTIEYAPNLQWKGVLDVTDLVSEKFGLPASLTNDANAAAIGEMMYGAARGMKDFIMITLGTGVGSGIVANGHLILGHDGFAGELGHTIIRPGGRKHWATKLDGSVEAYCSATGIVITAKELLATSTQESLLRNYALDELDSKKVFDCAIQGDAIAAETYRFTGQILGEALANFVMFSSPEAIILFGGVIKAGNLLLNPTREHMEKNLLPIFQNKVKLIFSELREADAAILGASALVWEQRD
ncbi:ROK family protein [Flavisolibacter tropicus]|uniref:Glucokinase n=1 Tax=Flavisolibacter tropicus TaxID=1492898 RepID=A0A172TRA1_9BACT|nr:ROK family protein [Flavisolibacter tropicus]ANE49528.1 glucokinase [Flavisolibacter tropicus]